MTPLFPRGPGAGPANSKYITDNGLTVDREYREDSTVGVWVLRNRNLVIVDEDISVKELLIRNDMKYFDTVKQAIEYEFDLKGQK